MMEITILGSGTATPLLHRNASGIAVRSGSSLMLVDMGPGILRRLCEAQIDYKSIDIVLVTHFHPDHTSDIVPFLFASNYAYGPMRQETFFLVGPQGLEKFYRDFTSIYGHWIIPSNERLMIRELDPCDPDSTDIRNFTITSVSAQHSGPSLSYRIEASGKSLVVSGDTDESEALVELAQHADMLICECSFPQHMKVPGHMTPVEAAITAKRASVKKLVLTHFYPPCDDVDVVAQAGDHFSGEIVKAEDLMVLAI